MTTLLLDTNVALWVLLDSPRLAPEAKTTIAEAPGQILVSVASVWEVAIKASIGKLKVPDTLWDEAESSGLGLVDVSRADAEGVRHLPFHHRDPFDRLLISQAQRLGVPLVTTDRRFRDYDVEWIPADR